MSPQFKLFFQHYEVLHVFIYSAAADTPPPLYIHDYVKTSGGVETNNFD